MFRGSIKLGRIFGIEVAFDFSLLFIAAFVAWSVNGILEEVPNSNTVENYLLATLSSILFIGSILWHELAHGILANFYKIRVRRIVLFFLGGVAEIQDEPTKAYQEFWIAFAGPISSALLGGIFLLIAYPMPEPSALEETFSWLGIINLLLAGFNMLPGFPLDGARVLRSGIWWITGSHINSTRAVSYFGLAIAAVAGFAGIFGLFFQGPFLGNPLINLFMAWFLYVSSNGELRGAQFRDRMHGTPVGSLVQGSIPVKAEWPLAYAADIMAMGRPHSAVPVMRNGQMVGVISNDLVSVAPRLGFSGLRVENVMQPLSSVPSIDSNTDTYDAIRSYDLENTRFFMVTRDAHPIGLISHYDLIAFAESRARSS